MKNTLEHFIEQANKIHSGKYDYSLITQYVSNKTKMDIICPIHGVFKQNYKSHISKKYGCPKCGGIAKKTTDEFICDVKKIHGEKYDYSLVNYVNNHIKVQIICQEHGVFEQKPNKHLLGHGCLLCSGLKRKSTNEFICEAKKIYGDKYDYSLVNYVNTDTKVKIVCHIHGVFEQKPSSHLNGNECRYCKKHYHKKEQHLYILYDKKYKIYKVGVSIDVRRRCRELNSKYYENVFQIDILKIYEYKGELEKVIHSNFKNHSIKHPTYAKGVKSNGRTEWFDFKIEECLNYIDNILQNE